MPALIFIHPDGRRERVEARSGDTVLLAAKLAGVDGLPGECGGSMACATCHVFVAESCAGRTGELTSGEDGMLDMAATPRRASSRLACQILLTDDLDGLELEIPEEQF